MDTWRCFNRWELMHGNFRGLGDLKWGFNRQMGFKTWKMVLKCNPQVWLGNAQVWLICRETKNETFV